MAKQVEKEPKKTTRPIVVEMEEVDVPTFVSNADMAADATSRRKPKKGSGDGHAPAG